MEEYIKWLENTLKETLDEIDDVYESEGVYSSWADDIRNEFKKNKEKFNPTN